MNYYLTVLRKYAVFRGRASRSEYWTFAGFNLIFGVAAFILDAMFRTSSPVQVDLMNFIVPVPGEMSGFIGPVYFLAVFMPFLAVTVRRLHDTGGSGWWCLLGGIPLLGTALLVIPLAMPGSREENIYGAAAAGDLGTYEPLEYLTSD